MSEQLTFNPKLDLVTTVAFDVAASGPIPSLKATN